MTPRQADIAHVLEGVPGVVATYALGAHACGLYDFAVHVESARVMAHAHYALERAEREHRTRVCFFCTRLAPAIAARATLLELTEDERSGARARAPAPAEGHAPPLLASSSRAFSRLMHSPEPGAPFTVLLVDVDDHVPEAMRRIFREASRHVVRARAAEAADLALTKPFHFVVSGHRAALFQGLLTAIAKEDPCGAERVVLVAPARDVSYVRWHLAKQRRSNAVLALPIDDLLLQREAFRDHPELVARVAVTDVARAGTPAEAARSPRFRRTTALVVDDDVTTEIVLASEPTFANADVIHAKTAVDAFEVLVTREIDLVLCSGTMRSDGGEPFYRVLWRLVPALKTRCVLVTTPDLVPSSMPASVRPRIVERPLRRDTIARVIDAYVDD